MRSKNLRNQFTLLILAIPTLLSACKNDSHSLTPVPVADQSFTESFDSATAALNRGWKFMNNSNPTGAGVWQNGGNVLPFFNAHSNIGTYVGFIGTDYTSTSAEAGLINNWLISPPVLMQNGDKIVFYTRAQTLLGYNVDDSTDFANRLQLCINNVNDDLNVGSASANISDVGNFSTVLVDINPQYYEWHKAPGNYGGVDYSAEQIANAYPQQWTRFEATISGLTKPEMRRFAFRYVIEEAGSNGRGSGIGIDEVTYTSVGH